MKTLLQITWSLFTLAFSFGNLHCKNAMYCVEPDSYEPERTDVFNLSVSCSTDWLTMKVSKNMYDEYLTNVAIDYNCTASTNSSSTLGHIKYRFGDGKETYTVDPIHISPAEACYFSTCALDLDCGWILFDNAPSVCFVEVTVSPSSSGMSPLMTTSTLSIPILTTIPSTSTAYDVIMTTSSLQMYNQSSFPTPPPYPSTIQKNICTSSCPVKATSISPSDMDEGHIPTSSNSLNMSHMQSSISIKDLSTQAPAALPSFLHITTVTTMLAFIPNGTDNISENGTMASSLSTKLSTSSSQFTINDITEFAIVPIVLVIIGALVVLLLCVLVIQRNKRNKFSERIVMEYVRVDDPNNNTVFLDQISFTESVVTIVASLETDSRLKYVGCDNGEGVAMATTATHNVSRDIVSNEVSMEIKEEERNKMCVDLSSSTMQDIHQNSVTNPSPTNNSSCTSCNSYIETTDNQLTTMDTSSTLHSPVRIHTEPNFYMENTIVPFNDVSIQSSLQYSDGYVHSTGSEGYITEHSSHDYIEHSSMTDPKAAPTISMCNAQVNDYVFQKKINNRFMYQSAPSSSGYQSSTVPDYITLPL